MFIYFFERVYGVDKNLLVVPIGKWRHSAQSKIIQRESVLQGHDLQMYGFREATQVGAITWRQ